MSQYRSVRGTQDILPEDSALWRELENKLTTLFLTHSFEEIRTPVMEPSSLFTEGMGVLSGIIERELWTFTDKHGTKLALRADMTSGIIRSFLENQTYKNPTPSRLFYAGPIFLSGTGSNFESRQCHQAGAEILGTTDPIADAEIIVLAYQSALTLGLPNVSVELNTLADEEVRKQYSAVLKDYFNTNSSKLCKNCKRRYKSHPTWVLSCEEQGCKELSQVAPTIYSFLSKEQRHRFEFIQSLLESAEVPFKLNPRVVRDIEYYDGIVFQVRSENKVVAFGGRYDRLASQLSKKNLPATGFAYSLDEVFQLLKNQEQEPNRTDCLFLAEGEEASKVFLPAVESLRSKGYTALIFNTLATQLSQEKLIEHYRPYYTMTLNETDAFRGHALLKNLDTGKTEKVSTGKIISDLGRKLAKHTPSLEASQSCDDSQAQNSSSRKKTDKQEEHKDDSGSSSNRRKRRRRRDRQSSENDTALVEVVETKSSKTKDPKAKSSHKKENKQSSVKSKQEGEQSKQGSSRTKKASKSTPNTEDTVAFIPVVQSGASAFAPIEAPPKKAEGITQKEQKKTSEKHVPAMESGLNWSLPSN